MIRIDRRQLIATAAIGIGAGSLPAGRAFAQALAGARGFTHNVASGEPAADAMLLWTRFVGGGSDAHVTAEIAETPDFARIVAANALITGPWRDWTVKITLDGLRPGARYFYRFTGPDGSRSPTGMTKTLPVGAVRDFGVGVFSCSNLPFGYFNAYAHAAARRDLDLWVHLGDYFYEFKRGVYPVNDEAVRMTELQPEGELLALADYRLRYAAYRTDPDLQALHARLPMIASQDDHESANDSWEGGAENHDPATEGDWATRKAAAYQAYREWLPVDELPYKSYAVGSLATLYKTDTRVLARSQQRDLRAVLAGQGDATAALKAFAQGAWRDPAVTMMGTTQKAGSPTRCAHRFAPARAGKSSASARSWGWGGRRPKRRAGSRPTRPTARDAISRRGWRRRKRGCRSTSTAGAAIRRRATASCARRRRWRRTRSSFRATATTPGRGIWRSIAGRRRSSFRGTA